MSEENVPSNENNWIDPSGTFGDMEKAPENVREFVTKTGTKDIGSLVTSYSELRTKMDSMPNTDNMISLPKEGDTESQAAFNMKMGCPESPDKYSFTKREGDVDVDDNLLGMFKQLAHKEGMPQAAFESTVRFQLDAAKAYAENYEIESKKETDDAQKAIRERFNTEDEYNDYTKKALGFAEQFKLSNGTSAADVLERKGLAYDPEILEVFGSLADKVVEAPLPIGGTRVLPNREAQLAAIKADPAFLDAMHPNHEEVFNQWKAMFGTKREG